MEASNHIISSGQTVFGTDMGFMAVAWSEAGLTRLCLPQNSREAVERRLLRLTGNAGITDVSPAWITRLIAAIKAYTSGQAIDFTSVPVDLAGADDFQLAIYRAARNLAFGQTVTYGELAKRAGHAGLARETGAALGANPVPLVIPCHRILAAGGKIGGFSAVGGAATKEKMLSLEGVSIGPPPSAQAAFSF